MRLPISIAVVSACLFALVSNSLRAQDTLAPYEHRVGTIGVGFFEPLGWSAIGELYLLRDRFSAYTAIGHPVCVSCGEHSRAAMGGGVRVFAGIPRVPFLSLHEATRVFAELYFGPVAQQWSPYRMYGGIGWAFGLETGDKGPGPVIGGTVGKGKSNVKRDCGPSAIEGIDRCEPVLISMYVAWTGWRRRS